MGCWPVPAMHQLAACLFGRLRGEHHKWAMLPYVAQRLNAYALHTSAMLSTKAPAMPFILQRAKVKTRAFRHVREQREPANLHGHLHGAGSRGVNNLWGWFC